MNAKQLAAVLNGREYRAEILREEKLMAKAAGLVVVYGYSDDGMTFSGTISDHVGCLDGGTAYLTSAGLLENDCDHDCPYFAKEQAKAETIEALWCAESCYSWTYKTSIPHETFEIVEDGEPYCRGIVFVLADVKAKE